MGDNKTPAPVPHVNVDELAQEIRRVDGSHSLGAGALAEALMPFLSRTPSPQTRERPPLDPTDPNLEGRN